MTLTGNMSEILEFTNYNVSEDFGPYCELHACI